MAIAEGHQPYFAADYMADRASAVSNPYSLQDRFHQVLSIQTFCNRVHSAMYGVSRMENGDAQVSIRSLLMTMESDLRELEGRFGSPRTCKVCRIWLHDIISDKSG